MRAAPPDAASQDRPPLRLAVYSDATVLGGAEVALSRVLHALPPSIDVVVVGIDDQVVRWLVRSRPTSDSMVLEPITDRTDLRGILMHRAMIRRLDVDLIQFNLSEPSSCQWAILAAATIPGLARIVVEHSPMGSWSESSARLKRLTLRSVSAHIGVGERAARLIEQSAGLSPGSIETIYHGVDGVGRHEVERSADPTVINVARHDPVKGVDVLLDAFALVDPPARLVLVGDGPQTPELRAHCTRLGLDDRVEFRDTTWDSVPAADLMWAFDAMVLPSRLEGFPVTIIEAMLSGLPVVATDVGSVAEAVVHGETGYVVPPEDPDALAAAITQVLADPERARRMGDAGRARALERLTIDSTVDSYLEVYRRVLDRDVQ